ncbi:MAG: Antibiotic biosynthesis monooxygenase [Gammaproteobacteria bacterium]|nr:Antibiotic biosynthesis monooxygenase [Gammaproteobacteria bacterium]
MFSVIFEVHPQADQWEAYLDYGKILKPELEQIDGFIDNIRYRSLTRKGWILSLSGWHDEKALVRWRTRAKHHHAQEKGRTEIFLDYRLRVGQVTQDTRVPDGYCLQEQRLDETQTGEGTTITLIDARESPERIEQASSEEIVRGLGLDPAAPGLSGWDVFDAVLTPGDLVALMSWRDHEAAEAFETSGKIRGDVRRRRVRVVRDYGMFERREAPQYYPDAVRRPT